MAEDTKIQVTFNPHAVRAPAQLVAAESNEAVSFFLASLQTADLSESPAPPQASLVYRLRTAYSADQRRDAFKTWIVAKGLGELVRGLRQSFEEAYLFADGLKNLPGRLTSIELENRISEIRRRANKLNFPDLIAEVQRRLSSTLAFEAEISSIIAVRNCLEHRHGVVGMMDADTNGILSFTLPRLQVVAVVDGKEVEVGPGFVAGESGAAIGIKRGNRTRTYRVGDKIEIDAHEFQEVAFAIHWFAEDLASKLPTS